MRLRPLLFLAFGLCAGPLAFAEAKVGDAFPPLARSALKGAPLPDLSGKVVLVDFCASWCAPCKASFPVYSRLQEEYGPRGLVILGISVDEDPASYAAFVKRLHPAFPVVDDPSEKLAAQVRVPGMPSSYLLDRSGRILAIHVGFHSGSTERDLRREIEAALGSSNPAASLRLSPVSPRP